MQPYPIMPVIAPKNVPEALHARLKKRAERNRRSLSKEAVVCLEQALSEETPPDDLLEGIRQLRSSVGLERRLTADEVQAAIDPGGE
jgi:plasmid stability protein